MLSCLVLTVLSCLILSVHVLSSHVFSCLVVFKLRFNAMGRPKGSTDKQQRKRRGRGGGRHVVPITALTPIFATSNNKRGNVTRQQRLFVAHFQDVPLVGPSVGDSVGLNVGDFEGLSVGAMVGISLGNSVGLHVIRYF